MRAAATTILSGGLAVEIAEGGPGDAGPVAEFMLGLSLDSRHDRFFSIPSTEALHAEVRSELTTPGNLSLIARTPEGRIVGHGLAAPHAGGGAELAFAIADDVQHHGLGTTLLNGLVSAMRARGVRRFEATMLSENLPMRAVFAGAGFTLVAGSGSIEAVLELAD